MKKNLVIITPDQLRADFLSCYGSDRMLTPNLDRLAGEGILFENCYCAAPLCAPSRISFATSTYVGEHGHRQYWSEISPDVPNLVTCLKKEGYRTGMFGKNHLFTYDRLPEIWDELDEVCLGNYDGHPEYRHSFSSFTLAPDHPFHITGRLTDELIDFCGRQEAPFCAWVNYQDPHPAFTCPPPYDTMFDPAEVQLPAGFEADTLSDRPIRCAVWRQHSEMELCGEQAMREAIAHYMGQVKYVDDCVGRILDALEEQGLSQNTVVLFFSDHGELLGDYGMTHKLPVFYDNLTKIPAILKAPSNIPQGVRCAGLVEEVDLVPTLLDILNIPAPATMVGKSWASSLPVEMVQGRDSVLCEAGGGAPTCKATIPGLKLVAPHIPTSFGPGAMLRQGMWKLTMYADDLCELYNLEKDPQELHNRYNDPACRERREEMTQALLKRILAVKMRDVGMGWDQEEYPIDVRFEPIE